MVLTGGLGNWLSPDLTLVVEDQKALSLIILPPQLQWAKSL